MSYLVNLLEKCNSKKALIFLNNKYFKMKNIFIYFILKHKQLIIKKNYDYIK